MKPFPLSPTLVGLTLPSSFSSSQAQQFREGLRDALVRAPRELIIDCAGLSFVDSTGLGLLALAQGEASRIGCTLKLANVVNSHVRTLLSLMQYDQLFPLVHYPMPTIPETRR